MKNKLTRNSLIKPLVATTMLMSTATASAACGDDFCIPWSAISNGGVTNASSNDSEWQLSGTIGQSNTSQAFELISGQWRLTVGFWSTILQGLEDSVFEDRFETE